MPFPDLQNRALFPTFASCPFASSNNDNDPNILLPSKSPPTYYLLGTIFENMTFTNTPTFICKDVTSSSFAVKILLNDSIGQRDRNVSEKGSGCMSKENGKEEFDVKKFRKGYTIAIPGALRKGAAEGKQGFIEVRLGALVLIPTSLEKLLQISQIASPTGMNPDTAICQACSAIKSQSQLYRCRGCESVWYCSKECQTRGWGEKSHKVDCKVLKVMREIQVRDGGLISSIR